MLQMNDSANTIGTVARGLRLPNLERERKLRFLSQVQLAEAAGIATATVTRAENGRPVDLPVVKKLADALGVGAAVLVGETRADA